MYIITGGAGFIGSALLWKLNSMGIDEALVVDSLGSGEKWKNLVNRSFVGYIHKKDFLPALLQGKIDTPIEAIFHLGACSSTMETNADYLMLNNTEYSKTLCQYALRHNIRFINASSAATYGSGTKGFSDDINGLAALQPLNMYGYSKHLFDLWAMKNNYLSKIVSLKFFNVYGPNEEHKGDMRSMINKAYASIKERNEIALFRSHHPDYDDGGQMRDFIYVKDCVEIIWWLVSRPEVNGVFNVGSGQARTWNDLAKATFQAMNRPLNIRYIDMPEVLRGKYQNYTQADMGRLRQAGYSGVMHSLEDGVADYVRNYLSQPDPTLELVAPPIAQTV
jgi:ADP-L-glycero-D-manno-heptose 6-epimerase